MLVNTKFLSTIRHAFPFMGLISIVWLGFWLSDADQVPNNVMPKDISQPLYVMHNFSSSFMNQDGQKIRSLSAKRLNHFEGDIVEMRSPNIDLATNKGERWFAQSDFAHFDHSNNAHLTGNVIIEKSDKHQTLAIETENLIYNFEQKTGKSESPVTIQGPGLTMSSTGIEFNLNTAFIELKSNVKGQYEPSPIL